MRAFAFLGMVLCGAALLPADGHAQFDRASILSSVRQSSSLEPLQAADSLWRILDPSLEGADSLWVEGVYQLATSLWGSTYEDQVRYWLRWAVRHGGEFPNTVVGSHFLLQTSEAHDSAVALVGDPHGTDAVIGTRWDWTPYFDAEASGRLRVAWEGDPSTSPVITVDGAPFDIDEASVLAPGTYRIEASAPDHDPVAVEREVLPGVTTRLVVRLAPQISAETVRDAEPRLIQLASGPEAQLLCGNGVVWSNQAVLARSTVLAASDVRLLGASSEDPLDRIPYDRGDGLGLLQVSLALDSPTWPVGIAREGGFAWALYRTECRGELDNERVRITAIEGAVMRFDRDFSAGALGGAVVDRQGTLLGIVSGVDRATALTVQAQMALDEALQGLSDEQVLSGGGGGLPWKWVGGAGAAGALAYFILGGSEPTTGEIIVVVPGA